MDIEVLAEISSNAAVESILLPQETRMLDLELEAAVQRALEAQMHDTILYKFPH